MQLIASKYKQKEIIKIIREWTELTQEEFAKSINLSKKAIESYEYGKNNVSLALLLEICEKYNIEIIIRSTK